MSLRSYRDLVVWQRAMELAEEVFRLTAVLAAAKQSDLASQLCRASCNIPTNVAVGYGRGCRAEYARHLSSARGSLAEVETLLMLSARIGYFGPDDLLVAAGLSDETSRMLTVLLRKLGSRRLTAPARSKKSVARPQPTASRPFRATG